MADQLHQSRSVHLTGRAILCPLSSSDQLPSKLQLISSPSITLDSCWMFFHIDRQYSRWSQCTRPRWCSPSSSCLIAFLSLVFGGYKVTRLRGQRSFFSLLHSFTRQLSTLKQVTRDKTCLQLCERNLFARHTPPLGRGAST